MHKRAFVNHVLELANTKRPWEVFEDFLEVGFCLMASSRGMPLNDDVKRRFERLLSSNDRVYLESLDPLWRHFIAGVAAAAVEGGDFLGEVGTELSALCPSLGQFFTPYDIASLTARFVDKNAKERIKSQGYFRVHEPAVGSGAMILAIADNLLKQNFDPAEVLFVVAQDVNDTAFKMAYIQLSVRRIPALVVLGNTLTRESRLALFTPEAAPFYARLGGLGSEFGQWLHRVAPPPRTLQAAG